MSLAVTLPLPRDGFTLEDWHQTRSDNPELRVELAEGSLIVIPTPIVGHGVIVSKVFAWLLMHGVEVEQLVSGVGVVTDTDSGRIPDLVLLHEPVDPATIDLYGPQVRLAVEVESKSTRATDRHVKPDEYARAGIAHYWRIEGAANPDTAHVDALRLRDGAYERYFSGALADFMASPPVFHDE